MLETLLPLLLIAGVALCLPDSWRSHARAKNAIERFIVFGLGILVLRYLWWRVTVTVLPAEGWSIQTAFVWTIFLIEMVTWLDASILFMALLRRTNRSEEADRHEARLRAMPEDALAKVDVFIPTYNEPLDVLEKTITGARGLKWPEDRIKVWILDDGKRDWLRNYCASVGVRYLTRDNNLHAKAGNINAAIKRTDAEFFLVLDADFVPHEDFLYRTVGFFEDPGIGIVQVPHNFFNGDPMQSNLGVRDVLPDDQRLFFDAIMPGRDGWDCAFCCGSNALTRRAAIEAVGGGLPGGSITEDMLLTLALLRKGYVTRYLNERLAVGLAAESLSAFFVQRARWAQGAMQILHLKDGPLGPGLKVHQRLFFLPTHWLTQSFSQIAAMATPVIYLWTGLMPLLNANAQTVLNYQIPAVVGTLVALRLLCPGQFFPLAASAHGVLQAFRLLPTIMLTLVKPHGHKFKVTPKGNAASDGASADRFTARVAIGLMIATAIGLLVNTNIDTRLVPSTGLVPIVAGWAIYNMLVLSVVSTIAVSQPMPRTEERFDLDEPCALAFADGHWSGEIRDISVSGAFITLDPGAPGAPPKGGDWTVVAIANVGRIPAYVRRTTSAGMGVEFHLPEGPVRHALVHRLYSQGLNNSTSNENSLQITLRLLRSVLRPDKDARFGKQPLPEVPSWVIDTAVFKHDRWPDVADPDPARIHDLGASSAA